MRRLSIRDRGDGFLEVGPAGHGPTVTVPARGAESPLRRAKRILRERGKLRAAAEASFRDNKRICTRPGGAAPVAEGVA